MAIYHYVVLTKSVPGQIDEFDAWYDGQHLPDACRFPGIKAAKRYKILHGLNSVAEGMQPVEAQFDSVAIYEMETDDPDQLARDLIAQAGTPAMLLSPAYDGSKTVKYVAVAAGELSEDDV